MEAHPEWKIVTTGWFPELRGTSFMRLLTKFSQIFIICLQSSHKFDLFSQGKHAISQISHEFWDEKREMTHKDKNDSHSDTLSYLQAYKLHKKEVKHEKKGQEAENSPASPLMRAKKNLHL